MRLFAPYHVFSVLVAALALGGAVACNSVRPKGNGVGGSGDTDLVAGDHGVVGDGVSGDAVSGDVMSGDGMSGDNGGGFGDEGCGPNQIVDGHGNCVSRCAQTSDCNNSALICNTRLGLCEPGVVVCNPAMCEPGTVCPPPEVGVECVPIEGWCDEDGDCSVGRRCDANACVSRVGEIIMTCTDVADCMGQGGLLLSCQAGVCVGCLDDLQCGAGNKCVMGACIIADLGTAGECIDANCPDGERCILSTGECAPTCRNDDECGEAKSCLPLLNYCVDEYGCDTADDCVPPLQCVVGLCFGCQSNDQCSASEECLAATCFPKLGNPCEGVTCADNEACDPQDGSCYRSNGTCRDDEDCRPGHTCNLLGLCRGCSVDGDCRPGQRCLLATCIPL